MKIFTTLTCLMLTTAALAQPVQTGIEKGTFGMEKATLEFLAADKQTFGTAKKAACENCTTDQDLINFIKVNNLTKANELVKDIKKHSLMLNDEFAADAFTSEGAVLDSLRRYILKRVTSGPERQHRTQLPAFASYQTRLTALAGGANPDQAVAEQTALQEEEKPADEAPTTPAGTGSSLGAWALGLSVLNLLGLAYLLFAQQRRGGTGKTTSGKTQTDEGDARIASLEDKNAHLNSSLAELTRRLSVLEKGGTAPVASPNRPADRGPAAGSPLTDRGPVARGMMPQNTPPPSATPPSEPSRRPDMPTDRNPSATPGPAGNQPRPAYQNPANPVIPPQVTPIGTPQPSNPMPGQSQGMGQTPPSTPPPTMPLDANRPAGNPERTGTFGGGNAGPSAAPPQPAAPTRLFARTADLGNGFSVAGLLPAAERGTVYELEPTGPNTAIFRVSQSLESQQLALSDPYSYLSDACVYENNPAMGSNRIQTVVPGQLVLQADKWQITEKARIGFV